MGFKSYIDAHVNDASKKFPVLSYKHPIRAVMTTRIPRQISPSRNLCARNYANSQLGKWQTDHRILTVGTGSEGVQYLGWPLDIGPRQERAAI